ncbi:hypothetical protein HPB50_004667 [Hyalomma asiaticum]|uniref:Uncharacterized protein n=1 Tax=Hyalomma asiaticum TaxID=266040 RepID=A0ACB7RJ72_HYAAI|nr:hypothetical protein HPB50_004667 [Hyalomma asiaticum]
MLAGRTGADANSDTRRKNPFTASGMWRSASLGDGGDGVYLKPLQLLHGGLDAFLFLGTSNRFATRKTSSQFGSCGAAFRGQY